MSLLIHPSPSSLQVPLEILFEDNHLLVVKKPADLPVQADQSRDMDLLTLCKQDLKARYKKPGNVYCGLVHRLDRPVGGVMVFAKTSKAAARLSEQFRRHQVEKRYLARISGLIEPTDGELQHYLCKDTDHRRAYVQDTPSNGYKEAILYYRTLTHIDGDAIVDVSLVTGRFHQIRAQFAFVGHPLRGDMRYGRTHSSKGGSLFLYAYQLTFLHPIRQERLCFRSFPDWFDISLVGGSFVF